LPELVPNNDGSFKQGKTVSRGELLCPKRSFWEKRRQLSPPQANKGVRLSNLKSPALPVLHAIGFGLATVPICAVQLKRNAV
jgi:hypothetical protein